MHNPVLRVIGATACQSPIWAHPPDGGPGCHEPNPAHHAMLGFGRLVSIPCAGLSSFMNLDELVRRSKCQL